MQEDLGNLVLIQFSYFGLGWLFVAASNRKNRIALLLWGLYNLLQALSLFLFNHLTAWGPPTGLLSIAAVLSSYALVYVGFEIFLYEKSRYWRLWCGLAGLGAFLAFNPGGLLPVHETPALALNIATALFGISAIWLLLPPFIEEFGRRGCLALLPTTLQLVYVLSKALFMLLYPEQIEDALYLFRSRFGFYMFALSAGTTVNMVFIGLFVSRLFQKLREQASKDELTRTLNRGTFATHLHHACFRYKRHHQPLTLAFIDIDHFKQINDTGGHAAGDLALRELAIRVKNTLRESDLIGRWGGEEFVALLADATPQQALVIVDRLQQNIMQEPIPVPAGLPPLTLSIGLAGVQSEHEADAEKLIQRADEAMYKAKNEGRNRIIVSGLYTSSSPLLQTP